MDYKDDHRHTFIWRVSALLFATGIGCLPNNGVQLLPNVERAKNRFSVVPSRAVQDSLNSNMIKPYVSSTLGKLAQKLFRARAFSLNLASVIKAASTLFEKIIRLNLSR